MGNFSARLRECRKSRHLTQEELAVLCGISYSTYRRYEAGENEPLVSAAAGIAKILGVSLDYLVGNSDCSSPGAPPAPIPAGNAKSAVILKKIRKLLDEAEER